MHNLKQLIGATAAAIPLAIALIYPVSVTAQGPARNAPDRSDPARNPVPPTPPSPGGTYKGPSTTPPPPGNYAPTPTTGLCAQGFAKTDEYRTNAPGNTQTGVAKTQVYQNYTCSGDAPRCPDQKAAAETGPKLVSATRQGGGGTDVSSPFHIRVGYEVRYDYGCNTPPITCLSKAANGNAAGVSVEVNVRQTHLGGGNNLHYKCIYNWTHG